MAERAASVPVIAWNIDHNTTPLDAALQLARAGLKPVFCQPREKRPILAGWQKIATCDEVAIRDMYARLRVDDPNVGVVLGDTDAHGYLIAVDVDDVGRLEVLTRELGPLPGTLSGRSPRGRRLFCRMPENVDTTKLRNVAGLLGKPGVDVKVAGGQVIVGPSIHPELDAEGREQRYAWDYPLEPIAELPAEWAQALMPAPEVPTWARAYTPKTMREDRSARQRAERYLERAVLAEARFIAQAREGMRNVTLHRALCRLLPLAHGCMVASGPSFVRRELTSAARACSLPETEIDRTVASAERWVSASGAIRVPPEPQPRAQAQAHVAPVVDIVTRAERPVVVTGGGSEGSVDFIKDPRTRQPAAIPENIARMLEQDPAWLGGPKHDRYSLLTRWSAGLPQCVAKYARLEREIVSADYGSIQAYALAVHELAVGHETVERGARMAAVRNPFDALQEWIAALPAWDGVRRLDTWLSTYLGCPDTPYHRVTGRAWLRAAMARAKQPGLLVDIVPVLQGTQKAGKNRAIEILFGGGPACAPWTATLGVWKPDHADTKRLACSRWILHDDEFSAREAKQVDSLKSWVSVTFEQWVAKYSNDVGVLPRRALLVCSVNQDQFLADPTGARRWMVWRVGAIDHGALERDRLQLLSEAALSDDWREGLDDVADAQREIAEEASAEDGLEDILRGLQRTGQWDRPLTGAELATLVGLPPEKQDRGWTTRLGMAVRAVAGQVARVRKGGPGKVRLYFPTVSGD